MVIKAIWLSLFMVISIFQTSGQTPIPGGDVSGTWENSASPYMIEGEINIPLEMTLVIEPGVEIIFQGHYKFNIYGLLRAEGTVADSILFSTNDHETGWHGLRFIDTDVNDQDTSKVSFCIIEYGKSYGTCPDNSGAGIYIGHSHPVISHSTIRYNQAVSGSAEWGGGGIYCEYANPLITDNLIKDNYSGHDGGGIYCGYCSPVIKNNTIIGNEAAFRGGGIANFVFSSPAISNNLIAENQSNSIGGGIYQSGGNAMILSNIIRNNVSGDGGGIACNLSNSRVFNNLIVLNEASKGAGIWNKGSSPVVINNTISNNVASSISNGGGIYNLMDFVGVPVYSNPLLINNIIYYNIADEGHQIYSSTECTPILSHNDIENLESGGIYGDITQEEGNLETNPEFDVEGEHPYALLYLSGCIDHGTENLSGYTLPDTDILGNIRVWDGSNSGQAIVDMGAYEYGAPALGLENATKLKNPIQLEVYPNPFLNSISIKYSLHKSSMTNINIYTLEGKVIAELVNNIQQEGDYLITWVPRLLPAGSYLIVCRTGSTLKTYKKIIKIDSP
ncbi:MAG: T9SS type A sorting domain-containing protein [Bacteroidales bacterium]|nr:T9SS type A sorting domain-containing protein [Bacteroidales bacterium]